MIMTRIPIDIDNRNFLQNLRLEATIMANNTFSERWARAYTALADAADFLDAMQARSSTIQSEGRPLNIGTEAGAAPKEDCVAPECGCDHHSGCCGDKNKD